MTSACSSNSNQSLEVFVSWLPLMNAFTLDECVYSLLLVIEAGFQR